MVGDDGLATLQQLAAYTRQHMAAAGFGIDDSRGFTPHVTAAKLSQLPGKLRRIKRIDEVWLVLRILDNSHATVLD